MGLVVGVKMGYVLVILVMLVMLDFENFFVVV